MTTVQARPDARTRALTQLGYKPEETARPRSGKKLGRLVVRYVNERRDRGEITKTSADCYRGILWQFAEVVGVDKPAAAVTRRDVERWLERAKVAPSTKRHRLSAVRAFFDWAAGYEIVSRNPAAGIGRIPQPRRVPRGLQRDEVQATLAGLPDARAEAIVLLECQEGLRAIEVAGLELGDLDRREGTIVVRGKGGHERVIPLSDETLSAIRRYLGEHPASAGPLIRSYTRPDKAISAGYVSLLASRWLHAAGVPASGHAFRHTAATDMLRASGDLMGVRDALGHVSIATTQRYLGLAAVGDLRRVMGGRRYKGDQ